MTPAMDGFADRLRVAMAARGNMSQGQLERAAGLSDAYVTKILGGKRGPPKSDKIEAIAVALNVRADWLTSGRLPSGLETSPVSTVVLDHRYPNATRAAEFLRHRANPVPEAAIQAAMARALSSDSDPTTDEWVIAMEYEAQRLRREGLGRVEREIADDGDMAPKKRKK